MLVVMAARVATAHRAKHHQELQGLKQLSNTRRTCLSDDVVSKRRHGEAEDSHFICYFIAKKKKKKKERKIEI